MNLFRVFDFLVQSHHGDFEHTKNYRSVRQEPYHSDDVIVDALLLIGLCRQKTTKLRRPFILSWQSYHTEHILISRVLGEIHLQTFWCKGLLVVVCIRLHWPPQHCRLLWHLVDFCPPPFRLKKKIFYNHILDKII